MSAVPAELDAAPRRAGSPEHKQLLARVLFAAHLEYDPERIAWPELSAEELKRLTALPFWQEAVSTENVTANTVTAAAALESDPELRRAIALQGLEEQRHARLLAALTAHYHIPITFPAPYQPRNLESDFLFAGFGECFDSFFALGLFALARESGFFPAALVALFDPVMEEEVRHILFFVNWVKARGMALPGWKRPAFRLRCAWIIVKQIAARVRTARSLGGDPPAPGENLTLTARQHIAAPVTLRGLLAKCFAENDRRMARYDARLLRPRRVPGTARGPVPDPAEEPLRCSQGRRGPGIPGAPAAQPRALTLHRRGGR
jgi:hypothetical protein